MEKSNKKVNVQALAISALMIALAMVLAQVKIFTMPQGGSVTLFSMLPIALLGYLLGPRYAILGGVCLGFINLMYGGYVIHPVQLIIDYPLAFGAMGLSGFVRNTKHGLITGYVIGALGRYACSVASGIIFFGAYAPENFNAVTWSLWYNITYIAAEGILTIIILALPPVKNAINKIRDNLNVA